ncbi:OB-fold protein [Tenacibaculum sp. C7A-26P2]|uniref:OB-fold protein n=1 Tax=Tenacibaculum sp. C7A-26P2 TaxID=3447504 RepID=UPI003F851840
MSFFEMDFSFFLMIKKQYLFINSSFVLLFGFILYCFFTNTNKIEYSEPCFSIASESLMKLYSYDEKQADSLYGNKVIEVFGRVKEVSFLNNRKTVFLVGNSENTSIICDIDESQRELVNQLKKNQLVYIKGVCKGYLKDIILLNCYLDTLKNNE